MMGLCYAHSYACTLYDIIRMPACMHANLGTLRPGKYQGEVVKGSLTGVGAPRHRHTTEGSEVLAVYRNHHFPPFVYEQLAQVIT